MRNPTDKKSAIAAYKERKPQVGIFAVRCAESGQVWVGKSPNLATIQNRIWFALRTGSNTNTALQAAWAASQGDQLKFEIVETIENEDLDYIRDANLKERHAHWLEALTGKPI